MPTRILILCAVCPERKPMKHLLLLATILLIPATHCVADETSHRVVTKEDMPRIPPTEPEDALATFRLAKGFQLELVAAEPLVSDPVDACFDEHGRMFVAEMHGYPFSHEPTKLNPKGGGKKNAGIIRLLEDTNGDGTVDKSHVYADGISWPTSVCCYDGGVFVLAPKYLYYFKDTDGDHKADIREVVLTGFGRGNVQGVTNGLQWGLDNHIYFAAGRNPKDLSHRGKKLFSVGSSDLRFNPKTEEFEIVSGGVQFGHSRDDWGTRFVCSNSNHIQQVVFSQQYISRNPFMTVPSLIRSIADDGASARVFRISPPEPWRIIRQKWRAADKGYRLVVNKDGGWEFIPLDPSKKAGAVPTEYPVGYFTSATGITIYRGDAYPDEYSGNAFVGDVGGNLVHRKLLNTDHVIYQARRADEGEEIVVSSDNWFRPVNFVNAPDGCLYILDMYRETIEHPYSIPEEIKAFLHLESGDDRGRIYRLVAPNSQRNAVTSLANLRPARLVEQLQSKNAWRRDTAQRLIWESQDRSFVPLLEKLLTSGPSPQGRLHALCTLDGLGAMTHNHLKTGLQDNHARVRARSVLLAESHLKSSSELLADLKPLCEDSSEHVLFQLASSLGESTDPQAVELLATIAAGEDSGNAVQTAVLSSCGVRAPQLLLKLVGNEKLSRQPYVRRMITELGIMVGANPDVSAAQKALRVGLSGTGGRMLLTAIGKGLARRGVTVDSVVTKSSDAAALRAGIDSLFQAASATALDAETAPADRSEAIDLLAFAESESVRDSLSELLAPQTPQTLQRKVVNALGQQNSAQVAELLLSKWRGLSPVIRRDVVDVLLAEPSRTLKLLAAVDAAGIKRADLDRDTKQQLLRHRVAEIKTKSKALFGAEVNTKRAEVVKQYQDVLDLTGSAEQGKAVFIRICSACHKVGDVGHLVAPELNSVRNKSEADLLIAILDPNREAQSNYNTYTAVTVQGRNYSGIIASDTEASITLRRAEAKQDVILRSNLEELVSNGVSLMPEGLEKDLTKQQLADVIAFIKSIGL